MRSSLNGGGSGPRDDETTGRQDDWATGCDPEFGSGRIHWRRDAARTRRRGRPMPLGFGGIFFEVPACVGATAIPGSVRQAQMALGAWLVGACSAAAWQGAAAHLLERFFPAGVGLAARAAELPQPIFQASAHGGKGQGQRRAALLQGRAQLGGAKTPKLRSPTNKLLAVAARMIRQASTCSLTMALPDCGPGSGAERGDPRG